MDGITPIIRRKNIKEELHSYIRECQYKQIDENLLNQMQSYINELFLKYDLKCLVNVSEVSGTVSIISLEGHDIFNDLVTMTLNELREEKLKRVLEDDEQ